MEELIEIQNKLKAPKNLYNKYGGFYYRNAESILTAVKPLLEETGCLLVLTDGNRTPRRAWTRDRSLEPHRHTLASMP